LANKKNKKAPKKPVGTAQEERMAQRYPALKKVPPQERRAIVRSALFSPVILLLLFAVGLLVLPQYTKFAFGLLDIERERSMLIQLAKVGLVTLLPICALVPLLTKFLMPRCIHRAMRKHGYDPDD
jgi:hypothetical protein